MFNFSFSFNEKAQKNEVDDMVTTKTYDEGIQVHQQVSKLESLWQSHRFYAIWRNAVTYEYISSPICP